MDDSNSTKGVTGVEVEQKKFVWTIKNFSNVIKHEKLIRAQIFPFNAGGSIGLNSKWEFSLTDSQFYPGWIGICLENTDDDDDKSQRKHLIAESVFEIRRHDGTKYISNDADSYEFAELCNMWAVHEFIEKSAATSIPLVNGNLIIHCTFRLFAAINLNKSTSVQDMLDEFNKSSEKKTCKDLAHLVKLPSQEVKLISNDGKQFQARKEVLEVRSPFFEATLRLKMKEEALREIELNDVSSRTLEILLHFFYTGRLVPQWKQHIIIPELTNAAAQYQLNNLLTFLDSVLGKVCVQENIIELLSLADKLGLKTAEEELLEFFRAEVSSSKEKLFKILGI